jgi:hypothetical protein
LYGRKKQLATLLQTIVDVPTVLAFYDAVLLESPTRRKISSHFYGKDHEFIAELGASAEGVPSNPTILIEDASAFKRSMPLLPIKDHALGLTVAV